MKRVLIIDDDEKLNNLLTDYLKQFGFAVISAAHPRDGLKLLRPEVPDIIILDIMLPEMDGFEVCREIRKQYSVPIIMLTARGDVSDRIVGLELGADDYLPKPFEPRELVARIQSVLRRTEKKTAHAIIKAGELMLDINRQEATIKGNNLELTTMEFAVLELLAGNAGCVLSRDKIIESTRGFDWDAFDRSIDVLISRLRTKLEDDARNPRFIKTIRGRGYMFIPGE